MVPVLATPRPATVPGDAHCRRIAHVGAYTSLTAGRHVPPLPARVCAVDALIPLLAFQGPSQPSLSHPPLHMTRTPHPPLAGGSPRPHVWASWRVPTRVRAPPLVIERTLVPEPRDRSLGGGTTLLTLRLPSSPVSQRNASTWAAVQLFRVLTNGGNNAVHVPRGCGLQHPGAVQPLSPQMRAARPPATWTPCTASTSPASSPLLAGEHVRREPEHPERGWCSADHVADCAAGWPACDFPAWLGRHAVNVSLGPQTAANQNGLNAVWGVHATPYASGSPANLPPATEGSSLQSAATAASSAGLRISWYMGDNTLNASHARCLPAGRSDQPGGGGPSRRRCSQPPSWCRPPAPPNQTFTFSVGANMTCLQYWRHVLRRPRATLRSLSTMCTRHPDRPHPPAATINYWVTANVANSRRPRRRT
jgi:hypothetical protein